MAFFYLFLFTSLVLGTFTVGPFSIRVYVTVAMTVYLLFVGKKDRQDKSKMPNKILLLLTIYLIFTALSLTMCGEFSGGFLKSLLSLYLNCYVTFYAINHFVKTPKQLKGTIVFMISLLAFNCLVTFLQYTGNPIGIGIALGLINDPEVQAEILTGQSFGNDTFGKDVTIGIFNYTFINANYIAIVGLMLLGVWESSKNKLGKIVCLFLYSLFVVASFVTQSRTPFILLLLFSLYIAIKGFLKKKYGVIIVASFILLLLIIIPIIIDSVDFGRLFDAGKYDNDPRQKIWDYCLDFLGDHILWGGPALFEKTYDLAPHNYFLGAFIGSGLFGGMVATFMYFYVLINCLPSFLGKHSMTVYSLAGAVLIYCAGSLFHNASMVSGDTMFFIIYCLMLKSQLMEREQQTYKIKINNNEETNNNSRALRH